MKSFLLSISILFALFQIGIAQSSIAERSLKSDVIVQGKFVEKHSFWNPEKRLIFTANKIAVDKQFKGTPRDTIEIITNGGVTEDYFQIWSDNISLDGIEGIFFLKEWESSFVAEEKFLRNISNRGTIRFTDTSSKLKAYDGFRKYYDIQKQIYTPLSESTGSVFRPQINTEFSILSDTIIEFDFGDIEFIFPDQLQFDVLVRANVEGLDFGQGNVVIEYNEETFGENVINNETVKFTKGELIANDIFEITANDETENSFEVVIEGGCNSSLDALTSVASLTTEYQQLFTAQIEIQDIQSVGQISMDDIAMSGNVYYLIPPGETCFPFDTVWVPDPPKLPEFICNIDSISPNPARGGIDEIITIYGRGFGGSPGRVRFPNADNGGASMMTAHPTDIDSWSDNIIKVKVPSIDTTGADPAGSGMIEIMTADSMFCFHPLEICWSAFNYRLDGGKGEAVRVYHANVTGDSSFIWNTDSILGNNADAVASIEKALCKWNSVSGINWVYGEISGANAPSADMINMIFAASPGVFQSADAPASTIIGGPLGTGFKTCFAGFPPNERLFSYVTDIDIAIRADLTIMNPPIAGGWNWNSNSLPSGNQADFYSTILHELGHAHLVKHANPVGKTMFWFLNQGDTLRTIDSCTAAGANFVIDSNIDTLAQGFNCPDPIGRNTSLCSTTSVKDLGIIRGSKIYPNPTSNQNLVIELFLDEPSPLDISIIDRVGRTAETSKIEKLSSGNHRLDLTTHSLGKGIYFLHIRTDSAVVSHKFLKL